MSFQKILVPLNPSPLASIAFEQALDLARCQRAELCLIYCMPHLNEAPPVPHTTAGAGASWRTPTEMGFEPAPVEVFPAQSAPPLPEQEPAWLQSYCQQASEQGVEVRSDCFVGVADTGARICEIARQWKVDLIIIGHTGRTGLAEAVLGSTSNHVFHHAPCAVLTIPE
ncbi:MAG: universal stress protein [Cyanobacteriota bacterium]|nr:universal stress protein [Cyanobacteriota bacterium]